MKGKLIWAILALAFLFRIVSIGDYPAGFNADEASFGYDAYSILKTGRDQWGSMFPLVLKSFGDYKAPIYSYISIPFVAVFGLNVVGVRIAGAIFGTLGVYATYLLTRKISKTEVAALWAALFLSVNPWSIMFGRGAFEANLISFFVPLAIYFFLDKKFFISSLLFGLSLFTYHSAKLITPLVILGLLVIKFSEIKKINTKNILLPAFVFITFFAALLYTFYIGGGARIAERTITQGALIQGFEERMEAIKQGQNPTFAKILHNKYQVTVSRFTNNYLQYFSPKFLFLSGSGEGGYGMIPGIGVLYLFEAIAIIGAIVLFWKIKKYRLKLSLLFLWLILTPLPAALSSGVGFAGNRAAGMLPILQIIAGFGMLGWASLTNRSNKNTFFLGKVFFGLLIAANVVTFAGAYFKSPDKNVLRQMGYDYLEVFEYLGTLSENRNIIVSRSITEPQIFIAFANKLPPKVVQEYSKNWDLKKAEVAWVDQIPEYEIGKFTIKSIDWRVDSLSGGIVVIRGDENLNGFIPLKTFYFPSGEANIYIIDTNQKIYAKVI